MFHLACDLLHGKSGRTGVALPCSFHRARGRYPREIASRRGGQERGPVRLPRKRQPPNQRPAGKSTL